MVTGHRISGREDAASELVGTILLIALTVIVSGGLSLAVAGSLRPTPHFYADLTIQLRNGDATWGNGDESVVVRHMGGNRLAREDALILIELAGTRHAFTGADLGSAFSDGHLTIGEQWSRTFTIGACTRVDADVVYNPGKGSSLLATQRLTSPGCPGGGA